MFRLNRVERCVDVWGIRMLWIKSFHIIFMVTWFAGLFYLPRLFVYHAMSDDSASRERFKIMERKLFFGIMTPSGILTIVFGLWLWLGYGFYGGLAVAQIALVAVLVGFYGHFGKLMFDLKQNCNRDGDVFYLSVN